MAQAMLAQSRDAMLRVLQNYGLKRDWAQYGVTEILRGRSVDDLAHSLLLLDEARASGPENTAGDPAKAGPG